MTERSSISAPHPLPPPRKGEGWRIFAALLALVSFSAPATAQHEHHAADADGAAAIYSPEDLQFLSHMIMHHQQAIDMGALVPERSDRADFRRFARYIAGAQAVEIRMMSGMQETAAERGLAVPDHAHMMHAGPMMAGMLSSAQMAALEASTGAEFERLWLRGMIFHHEGALAMARVQQLQQLANGRRPPGLDVIVEDIVEVQRAEIGMMYEKLDEWGLADPDAADRGPPAVETSIPTPGATLAAGEETTLLGVAVDDADVAAVEIAIQDLSTDQWLQSDGAWGARVLLPAETVRSGRSSTAWRFAFAPPPGRYALHVEAVDVAGERTAGEPRELVAH